MSRSSLLIAAALSLCGFAVGAQAPSQLCIAAPGRPIDFASDCVTTDKDSTAVTPAAVPRRYVWRAATSLGLGVIGAGEAKVTRPVRAGDVVFDLRVPAGRRVPQATVRIAEHAAEEGWRWIWQSAEIGRRHMLQLPEGRFTLEVAAEGFRMVRQTIEVTPKPLRLPALTLEPLPVISGSVVLPDGSRAIGVTVSAGTRLQMTDASGRFAALIDDEWPDTISIESAGFARKVMEVPKAQADVDLGTIKLLRGGSIVVAVDGDRADLDLKCELLRGDRVIRSTVKKDSARRVSFEALEPGAYQLRLRGGEPLQTFATRVKVEEGRVSELPITITPHALNVSTYLGNEKLPDARVWFRSTDFHWENSLKTDADGHAVTELWQPGRFLVSAETASIDRRYAEFITIEDIVEPELTLRLPDRKVKGSVLDERGLPVPHAEIFLETSRPGPEHMGTTFRVETDDTGRFMYRTVAAGHQKVTARADGFLLPAPVEFDLQDSDADHEIPIRLRRGMERTIVVVDADGVPIGEAVVVETAAGNFLGYRATDFTGKLSFQVPAGEERTLFVIPRQGSFAIARLTAAKEAEDAPLRIVVPSPGATLEVTTQTRSGAPAPNIWFLVRYNGQVIPFEVLQLFDRVQGLKFFTGATGFCRLTSVPVGTYELWPVLGGPEAREILLNRAAKPPVRVDVTSGENSAVLTFSPAG